MRYLNPTLVTLLIVLAFVCQAVAQRAAAFTIDGKLLKSDSKPLQYTELELVPVGADAIVNDSRLIGVSDTFGRFRFTGVPPGEYTLSINFGEKPTFLSPFSTYFYPGAAVRSGAMVFKIDEKTRISGLVFKLPTALVKKPIVGRISWPDGRPVQGAVVMCRDLEFDVRNAFGGNRSDRLGRFALEAFEGRKYQLAVMLFDRDMSSPFDPGNLLGIAESDEFVLSGGLGPIEIRLGNPKEPKPILEKHLGE
jgi:hypothetical protein